MMKWAAKTDEGKEGTWAQWALLLQILVKRWPYISRVYKK
jgi:hypothetical protein